MNLRQLPNAITLARIGMAWPLWRLLIAEDYRPALFLALIAGLSDALDGLLAKHFGWITRLGGLLDPVADKLLLAVGFLGLWWVGQMPGWLVALVLGRDVVILAGALAWQLLVGPLVAEPSRLSKATTAAQIGLVLLVLACLALGFGGPALIGAGAFVVAALTLASGIDYVWRWTGKARRRWRGEQA